MSSYVWTIITYIHIALFIILFLIAAFGRKLGLRKLYTNLLLKLFQFSQNKVEKKRKIRLPSCSLDESDVVEDVQKISFSQPKYLGVDSHDNAGFHLDDILVYIRAGVSSIVEDAVLTNFVSEEPPCWNLLSRTNTRAYEFVSFRLTMLWMLGFFVRYFFFLPARLLILLMGMLTMIICTFVVGALPDGPLKRNLNARYNIFCFDFVAGSLSLVARFHNPENRPKSGITVANHTSPIDSMILSTDNVYDMVGQFHGGLLGYFMNLLSRSSTHIWFERSNSKDRSEVSRRLKEHTANPDLPPILIFPEGVCVNNTSVVQFKKGAFEIDSVIYPVAIRFDPLFGDAYWWQDAFFSYVLYMMTSWAIVCDVWYLPPVTRHTGETAVCFANRVKGTIALQGGMSDVSIDGFLKSNPPKADLKSRYQKEFSRHCYPPILEEEENFDHLKNSNEQEKVLGVRHRMIDTNEGTTILKTEYDRLKAENESLRMKLKMSNDLEEYYQVEQSIHSNLSSAPMKVNENEISSSNLEELSESKLSENIFKVYPQDELLLNDGNYENLADRFIDSTPKEQGSEGCKNNANSDGR